MVTLLSSLETNRRQTNKLGVFATAPAIRHFTSNFFGEALGTFILVILDYYH